MTTRQIRDELLRLESALASRDGSNFAGGLASLIADDFLELGSSGRTWTAETVRQRLAATPSPEPVTIHDFAATALGTDVVLVTYRTKGRQPANRSSIWVRREGCWVVRFHQGTPLPG